MQPITPDISSLSMADEFKGKEKFLVGYSATVDIVNIKRGILRMHGKNIHFKNDLHMFAFLKPLLSVKKKCNDYHCYFKFHPKHCLVKDQITHKLMLQGVTELGL